MVLPEQKIKLIKKNILENSHIDLQASLIRCMGDPSCLKILYVLSKEKEVCPSDLVGVLDISMPAVSHHLARFKQMGIVSTKRMGQTICYRFTKSRQAKVIKKLLKIIISNP